MNIHIAIVNLAKPPVAKTIAGRELMELRVADSTFGKNDITNFYNVTVSGPSAATAKRLAQGDSVLIAGTLSKRSWKATKGPRAGQMVEEQEMKFGEIKQVVKSPTFFGGTADAPDDEADAGDDLPEADVPDVLADIPF